MTAVNLGARLAFTTLAVLAAGASFALGGSSSNVSVPSHAVISPDGNHSVWIKEDGSGFWLAERSTPGGEWVPAKDISIRGMPGCKSSGCPVAICAAVGTTWRASKLRGLNIKEYLQPRNFSPREVVFAECSGKPTQAFSGEGR